MIATIRTHDNGNSSYLCDLDLMRFSEEQIRDRMEQRGIKDNSFFITGFSDWGVDVMMSLKEAYFLKRCIIELYDSDDFVVVHQLRKHMRVIDIVSRYFIFVTKDEVELMKHLLDKCDVNSIVDFWYKTNNWVSALNQYLLSGKVLSTERGFYVEAGQF